MPSLLQWNASDPGSTITVINTFGPGADCDRLCAVGTFCSPQAALQHLHIFTESFLQWHSYLHIVWPFAWGKKCQRSKEGFGLEVTWRIILFLLLQPSGTSTLVAPIPIQADLGHLEPKPLTALVQFCPKHSSWLLGGESTRPECVGWEGLWFALLYLCTHTDEVSGAASSGVLLALSVSSIMVFALQIYTIPMSLPLSVTATRTVSAGVNSSCDGMSENPCYLSLPWACSFTGLVRLFGCTPFIRNLQEPNPRGGEGNVCGVSTLSSQLGHRHAPGFLAMVWRFYFSLGPTYWKKKCI